MLDFGCGRSLISALNNDPVFNKDKLQVGSYDALQNPLVLKTVSGDDKVRVAFKH